MPIKVYKLITFICHCPKKQRGVIVGLRWSTRDIHFVNKRMAVESVYFQWPDYVVLAIVLLLSAAIGFYYAFTGGRQKTTKEYLFADKNVHWIPVSCSLLAR